MPPPHRLAARVVAHLLAAWFPPAQTLVPSADLGRDIVGRCSEHEIVGGAVYDALVGLTAAESGVSLLTRDERAARTYARLGVAFELVT
jgi:hypothetical protein